ncbi:DNA-damage-inducible protein [Calothrix sp. NIES-2100]|nr:DNA-damage-inducible protein [Calothrix sp. NIES-2100]
MAAWLQCRDSFMRQNFGDRMDAIIKYESNSSPFDQIKHMDADGSEYWLATELLTLLGYQT